MFKPGFKILVGLAILCYSSLVQAGTGQTDLLDIQHQWAVVNYTLEGDAQKKAFEKLVTATDKYVSEDASDARRWIWSGIIKSSFAGSKGGFGALSLAKAAKKDLEKALTIDDKALDGSAYTSLGTMYYRVPGWPLGFGSNKKAAKNFKKALEINPDGIDPNFFYGEFLFSAKHKYSEAEQYLLKARNAAPRPTRPLADRERQKEVATLLVKVEKKIKKKKHR